MTPIVLFAVLIGIACIFLIVGLSRRVGVSVSIAGMFILFIGATTETVLISEAQPILVDSVEEIDYSLSYPMNVTTSNASESLDNAEFGSAEQPSNINSMLYLTKISCITMDLSKSGAPTGNAQIGILGGTSVMTKTFATLDVTTLTTTQRTYTFCLPNHDYWIIALNDRIGILYNAGSAGNSVNVFYTTTNAFDGTNSVRNTLSSGGTWSASTTSDMRFILTTEDITVNEDNTFVMSEASDFTLDAYHRIIIALAGITLIIIGALYFKND